MKPSDLLKSELRGIDRKGYKAYKNIKGLYDFNVYKLYIDYVQGDPFAHPSRVRTRIDRDVSGFPEYTSSSRSRTIALCDYLTRTFYLQSKKITKGNRGSGKSGIITIEQPVQEILERSSMVVTDDYIEARFFMGLPADGRKILAGEAISMFFDELPKIVHAALLYETQIKEGLQTHVETSEDADFLRNSLEGLNLIAFVANGALLPRSSGIDPRPLKKGVVIPFETPEEYLIEIKLPNYGTIKGMGIPYGITLIAGGGFHGKSTLLNALELGVYNHIPGDGREYVVSNADTVKLRAADGRNIVNTDISAFINNLPLKKDTKSFSTGNASGSTSQAAGICEAIELGATVFLLDEDTCATNFMIRDSLMQQLVEKKNEPITPFVDRVKQLSTNMGISTIIVMGGSGDYFKIADRVICMTEYKPVVTTEKAKYIADNAKDIRKKEVTSALNPIKNRKPQPGSFNPYRNGGRVKVDADSLDKITLGWGSISFHDIEQLVEISQTRAIAWAVYKASELMTGEHTLSELIQVIMKEIENNGLDCLTPEITGDLSFFRPHELSAVINRARTLKMLQLP